MRNPEPRAEFHQLDDETQLGIVAFALIILVVVVVVARAHPWAAAAVVVLVAVGILLARRLGATVRDRAARRADPPAPGVIIGHVTGDWPGARPRPFRLPWSAFRQHVLVAGPTGRGKTFTFIEPLLRAQTSRAGTGIFYLDGKGDPIHETVPFDHVFYPERPELSARWNPLAGPDPVDAANLFAAGLFPEATTPDSPGSFYAARAVYAITRVAPAMAITGFGTDKKPGMRVIADTDGLVDDMVALGLDADTAKSRLRKFGPQKVATQLAWHALRPGEQQGPENFTESLRRSWPRPAGATDLYDVTLAQLSRVMFSPERLKQLAVVLEACAKQPRPDLQATIEQLHHDLAGLLQLPERERATVFQSLQNRLGSFLEPPFAQLCSSSDFATADIAAGARVAFLLPTGRFPNTAKPLGRVALSQFKNAVLASAADREKVAVLDEFHNFVSADFAAFLNQARSRGGAAIMALQSLGDLPRDEADAMLANISTLIVTPGSRPKDAEYFAEAFGKIATPKHTLAYEAPSPLELRGRANVRTSIEEDYRYTPTQIAELDPREAIIQVTAKRQSWPATRVVVERAHG